MCSREMRISCKILFIKHEWKRLLARPRYRWEDDIKMDLIEIGHEDVE
jgi:hypothetical protein